MNSNNPYARPFATTGTDRDIRLTNRANEHLERELGNLEQNLNMDHVASSTPHNVSVASLEPLAENLVPASNNLHNLLPLNTTQYLGTPATQQGQYTTQQNNFHSQQITVNRPVPPSHSTNPFILDMAPQSSQHFSFPHQSASITENSALHNTNPFFVNPPVQYIHPQPTAHYHTVTSKLQVPCTQMHLDSGKSIKQTNNQQHYELTTTDRNIALDILRTTHDTNGDIPKQLLIFFINVLIIMAIAPLAELEIIKMFLPRVKERLFVVWFEAVKNRTSWVDLHKQILKLFFPGFQIKNIQRQFVERLQLPTETLAAFIHDIKTNCEALLCDMDESFLVEMLLQNMDPNNSKYMVFQARPANLQQLNELATEIELQKQKIKTYNETYTSNTQHNRPSNTNKHTYNKQHTQHNFENVTCFKCHRKGHFANECRYLN